MFIEGDYLAVIPDEGFAPQEWFPAIVLLTKRDTANRPACVITKVSSEDGSIVSNDSFFGLSIRLIGPGAATYLTFHVLRSLLDPVDAESGHGFVEVHRIEFDQLRDYTGETWRQRQKDGRRSQVETDRSSVHP